MHQYEGMMKLTKQDYYKLRAQNYPIDDREALFRYRRLLGWFQLKDEVSIIEVGCKFAVLRDMLKNLYQKIDYRGIDIDLETLKKIEGYNSETFLEHDVNQGIPFEDASADYLVCLEVLEHLENATAFLSEAFRVLKPGGRLFLSVPNPYSWNELIVNAFKMKDTEGHIASFTQQNIDALTTFAGLKVMQVRGGFFRIPFSNKIFGKPWILPSNQMFLTRYYMYEIGRESELEG